MRPKAPQSWVKINKNLRLTTVESQLFEQGTIHINRNRIGSLGVNIATKEHSVDEWVKQFGVGKRRMVRLGRALYCFDDCHNWNNLVDG